ncbi:MAG: 3',5'-cyclic-nucleotide phosphodiesterase [Fuerstiella sp.]|nr:3',5'-cyclic-nucleotide phosphodiesterase [Fuerstiella sp.]
MKVELLPSTVSEPVARQFCIGAVVNDTIAIDAGTLGLLWPLERQRQIHHVFLSHSHMDHIATVPLFLDNVYQEGVECPIVYADEATQQSLRNDVFNDRLWPDFFRLSTEQSPFLDLRLLVPEVTVTASDLSVRPVLLNHIVPSLGFVLSDRECAVAFVSDTGPTKRMWKVLSETPNLKAVFLEASFPDSHRWLAEKSGHLCPELFASEIRQLPEGPRIIACHLKPGHFDTIAGELRSLGRSDIEIGVPGHEYRF